MSPDMVYFFGRSEKRLPFTVQYPQNTCLSQIYILEVCEAGGKCKGRAVLPSWLGVGTTSLRNLPGDSAAPGKVDARRAAPSHGLPAGTGTTGRNTADLLRSCGRSSCCGILNRPGIADIAHALPQ